MRSTCHETDETNLSRDQLYMRSTHQVRANIPNGVCLLPNKQWHTYNKAFLMLKEVAQNLDLELNPSTVMSDFELALIQAVELHFPNAQHRGCYYHWWRRIRHHQRWNLSTELELGGRPPSRKKRFIEKDKQILALFDRFKEGQYSLSNFLDAIKYQTGL